MEFDQTYRLDPIFFAITVFGGGVGVIILITYINLLEKVALTAGLVGVELGIGLALLMMNYLFLQRGDVEIIVDMDVIRPLGLGFGAFGILIVTVAFISALEPLVGNALLGLVSSLGWSAENLGKFNFFSYATFLSGMPMAVFESPVYILSSSIAILAAIAETIFFQGGIYQAVIGLTADNHTLGIMYGAVISSLIFCMAHLARYSSYPWFLVVVFVAGVVFCLSYELSGYLSVPLIGHLVWNFATIYGFSTLALQ